MTPPHPTTAILLPPFPLLLTQPLISPLPPPLLPPRLYQNYLGHSKVDHDELYVYPDTKSEQGPGVCIADQAPTPGESGYAEVWANNTCVMYSSGTLYDIWSCEVERLFTPLLQGNHFYVPAGVNATFNCNVNGTGKGLSLEEWQGYGEDVGSTVEKAPSVQTVIEWGRELFRDFPAQSTRREWRRAAAD